MSRRGMLMAGYYPPVIIDLNNGETTVPYGYTRCEYTLSSVDEGGGAEAILYKNGGIVDSAYSSDTKHGETAVTAGDRLAGYTQGISAVFIILKQY